MQVTLEREFPFEAAHRLPKVPAEHKCFRLHGHSYRITVVVKGPVDPKTGWYIDFADLKAAVSPIIADELDHRYLNDVPGLDNPTSELLAAWLWRRLAETLPGLFEIRVAETCTSSCSYHGE